jgi:large subunit ribosomal protein L21
MYAIVQAGSKQFKVQKGDLIDVDLIEAQPGQQVDLSEVLLVCRDNGQVQIGAPKVPGCIVKAEHVADVKGTKITSLKYKKRKNEYRKFGHRQKYSRLKITDIQG